MSHNQKRVDCGSGQIRLAFSSDEVPTESVANEGWELVARKPIKDIGYLEFCLSITIDTRILKETLYNEVL